LHGIILLGDAAHVTSPFAGGNDNLALLDAYEIGKELVKAPEKRLATQEALAKVDKGFRTYKRAMWEIAQERKVGRGSGFKGAPGGFVELIKSYGPPPAPESRLAL